MFSSFKLFAHLGDVSEPELMFPDNGYVTEDGVDYYVTEDGLDFYVQES